MMLFYTILAFFVESDYYNIQLLAIRFTFTYSFNLPSR